MKELEAGDLYRTSAAIVQVVETTDYGFMFVIIGQAYEISLNRQYSRFEDVREDDWNYIGNMSHIGQLLMGKIDHKVSP